MAYEQKNNSGSLFVNKFKEKETQPDYKGSLMVEGVLYDLAAWSTTAKSGVQYLSIKVSTPKVKEEPTTEPEPGF